MEVGGRAVEGLRVSWVGISGCVQRTCFALGIVLLVYGRCLHSRLAAGDYVSRG